MVRPRFARLDPAQQQAIVSAAVEEFAAHGFHDASLNRLIEAAGISKGSMYYYFDGKDDLYAYVTRVELERMFAHVGPFAIPTGNDPESFWSTLESYYLRLTSALRAEPQLAALLRGLINAPRTPAMQQDQQELDNAMASWVERALRAGQRIGAVRTDLPSSLLIAIVAGMGQAMDTWLLTQPNETTDLPSLIEALTGIIRQALQSPT